MGIISQGVYGALSGKTGNLIGASWKGIPYLRIKPASVANPNTLEQQIQRRKFSLTLDFLQPFRSFLSIGLKEFAVQKSPFNCGMSFNVKNAISGVFPDLAIDYSKAILSRGTLITVANPVVTSVVANIINITWDNNSGGELAEPVDKSMVVAYFPETGEAFSNLDGAQREAGMQDIEVPARLAGKTAHVFFAFKNAKSKLVSNNEYIGPVVVAA